MFIFDIIIIILLLWAFFKGLRDGIAVQLGGLAGLFIGAYLAFRFGTRTGLWLGIDENYAAIGGFLILLVVVILGISILARVMKGVFRMVGLAFLDKTGGAVLSVLKTGLILSLLAYCFDNLNRSIQWADSDDLHKSKLYEPLVTTATRTFPYMEMLWEIMIPEEEEATTRPAVKSGDGGERTETVEADTIPVINEEEPEGDIVTGDAAGTETPGEEKTRIADNDANMQAPEEEREKEPDGNK